jgi:hypothetical protein
MYVALSTVMEEDAAKCYIIGDEPNQLLTEQHTVWNNVRNHPKVEYVPSNETDRIVEYLEKHDVKPVMPKEDV